MKPTPNLPLRAIFQPLATFLNRLTVIGSVLAVLLADGSAAPVSLAVAPPTAGPALDREPIKPIPVGPKLEAGKVALGRALFHDPRLSRDNTVSCASCHDLGKGGADGRARSLGIRQAEGEINTPSVFNSALNFKQFWDGRAATLEEQIDFPVQNPIEMGATWKEVVEKLRAVPTLVAAFAQAYPAGIEVRTVKDALAQFERSLLTPNSRFDKFLRGDRAALSFDEQEGYRKFKTYGCTSCHQGVNVGGNMFETLGAMADYFKDRGNVTKADFGRFNVTGREEDRFVFKVPGLRNVALTAPYLHDASASTLEEVVMVMAKYQLGEQITPEDVRQIVQFLKTLTGEYEGKPL